MHLILLYGPPAVGKLTVARALSALTGYGVLHNHLTFDLAKVLYAPEDPRFFPLNASLRLHMVQEVVAQDLPGVILTCVYASNSDHDAHLVQDLVRVVEAQGGECRFIQLVCTPTELERRVVQPDRQAMGKPATVAMLRAYLQRWQVFNPIPCVQNLTVDIGSMTPAAAAQHILRHMHWEDA